MTDDLELLKATDDVGQYFQETMFRKRDEDPAGWTAASKRIGW